MWDLLTWGFLVLQETTRGPAIHPQIIPFEQGPLGPQIDWKQLLAAITVISTVVSAAVVLMMKFYIEPRLMKVVNDATVDMKIWAAKEFPSREAFTEHAANDRTNHAIIDSTFKILNVNMTEDRQVIADIRDRLARLEGRE